MDFNDTPLPPADPTQMPQPGDMGGDPMGGMPPAPDGGDPMAGGGNGVSDELMQVLGSMPEDKQDTVLKYAKSMVSDDGAQNQGMPMESVSEAIRDVTANQEYRNPERKDGRINPKVGRSNPFHDKW